MYDELNAFLEQDFVMCDKFEIHNPTIDEIRKYGEQKYWQEISIITATPADEKLYLYSLGIDYNTVQDWQLFILLCQDKLLPSCLMLPNINFKDCECCAEEDSVFLYDNTNNLVITEEDYLKLTTYLRQAHGLKKNEKKDGNEHTRKWRLQRELERLEREIKSGKQKVFHSQLKTYISTLTNLEGFKYDWYTVRNLPINVFIDSLFRLQVIDRAKSLNQGLYSGNIDYKKMKNKEEFNWLRPIKVDD